MTAEKHEGPLSDVRVLEVGTLIAGPFCGQLLGDLGAEVIKVEDPTAGDPMRDWGHHKPGGISLAWPIIARNKKSVTCDLRTLAGQNLLRRLAAKADVVLENFRPGTLERWGLGYERLAEINSRLIMVRVSGFGQDGPYASRTGFGSIGEAVGGIRYVTGEPDRPPSRVGVSLGDSLAGAIAALGTLTALHARQLTGRGQIVDTAIYEAVLAFMESLLPEWAIAGAQRERSGAILPHVAPSNVYRTADGAGILIAANRDTVFARLCKAMNQPALTTDPRYSTHQSRGDHQSELDEHIGRWTIRHTAEQVLGVLHEAGVPSSRIYKAADMLDDPHFVARSAVIRLFHSQLGEFPMQNVVPRLSDTPGYVRWLGPELGQHNEEVYLGLLGMNQMELDRLRAEHAI